MESLPRNRSAGATWMSGIRTSRARTARAGPAHRRRDGGADGAVGRLAIRMMAVIVPSDSQKQPSRARIDRRGRARGARRDREREESGA